MKKLFKIAFFLIFPSICSSQTVLESVFDYDFEFDKYSEMYDIYSRKNIHINDVEEYIFEHPGFGPIELFNTFGFKNADAGFLENIVKYDKIKFEQIIKKDNFSTLNKDFIGNEYKHSSRFELEKRNFVMGGLIEKDIGEKSAFDNKKIFLRLDNFLRFKRVIIGDFKIKFGQGLTVYQGMGVFKGGDPIYPVKKRVSAIRKNNSFTEESGFRGIALNKEFNFGGIYLFYSNKNRDANLSETNKVTSLYLSGYHRTENENGKKGNLKEITYGGRVEFFIRKQMKFGVNFYDTKYDKEFAINSEQRQTFNFTGNHHNLISLDSDIFFNNTNIFFEYALDKNRKNAIILGMLSKLNRISSAIIYRNYETGFTSFFENGFSESQNYTKNEKGCYFGIQYKNESIKINGYYDLFKYSWRSYFNHMPIKGYEFLLTFEYKLNKYSNLKIKYKSKNKEENQKLVSNFNLITNSLKNYKRRYIRVEHYYKQKVFRYKFGLEYSFYSENSSQIKSEKFYFKTDGTIIENYLVLTPMADLEIALWHVYHLSGTNFILFYKFEHDLPGQFNVNPFSGRGDKKYVKLNYNLNQNVKLVFKISEKREFGSEDIPVPEQRVYSLHLNIMKK